MWNQSPNELKQIDTYTAFKEKTNYCPNTNKYPFLVTVGTIIS